MNKKKVFTILIFLLPLALLIPGGIHLAMSTLKIFPGHVYNRHLEAHKDKKSTVTHFSYDAEKLNLRFILETDQKSPRVFITQWFDKRGRFLDLSDYGGLVLNLGETTPGQVTLYLKTFEDGISSRDYAKAATLRHNELILPLSPYQKRYEIKLEDFETPRWWFDYVNVPMGSLSLEKFSRVAALDFQFKSADQLTGDKTEEIFTIKEIFFYKKYPSFFVALNLIVVCFYMIAVFRLILKRSKRKKMPSLNHKPLEVKDFGEEQLNRMKKYIESNYHDPLISTGLISEKTGIPASHISKRIKENYGITCKQFIARVRINEAKRMLRETDLRIVEIACEIGFNDISTFNRYFKQIEECSPRQYRSGV